MTNKITNRKLIKSNILNAIRAMDDKLINITFIDDDKKVYIKDTKNTMIIESR